VEGEKVIAGLRCSEVVELLSEYLGGELAPERRARVEEHVTACDQCGRFGARFARMVELLRDGLTVAASPSDEVLERLDAALDGSRLEG
jgi:anti-sigma factor RsiW